MNNLIKLAAVLAKTKQCRSKVYKDVKTGKFPAPIKLGPRSVAWIESEVDQWIESLIDARDFVATA